MKTITDNTKPPKSYQMSIQIPDTINHSSKQIPLDAMCYNIDQIERYEVSIEDSLSIMNKFRHNSPVYSGYTALLQLLIPDKVHAIKLNNAPTLQISCFSNIANHVV